MGASESTESIFAALKNIFIHHRHSLGWLLLTAAFLIGLLVLPYGEFGDEADNLVGGELLLHGYSLYTDVFTHHFPFPYYWVAAAVALFGKSIWAVRFSVLIFQTLAFGSGMGLSRGYLVGGAAALLWSVLRPLYLGHMVLYTTFASAALAPIFLITLAVLLDRIQPNWKHWTALGAFSVAAFWSDPQTAYAVGAALLLLASKRLAWGIKPGLVFGAVSAAYLGLLLVGGSFDDFWETAVAFNTNVYRHYISTPVLRLGELMQLAVRGLDVSNPVWYNFSPLRPITEEYTQPDRWLFTGFFYRFAVLAGASWLALTRRFRPALFLYLFAASALLIHPWGFRSQPFVLVSLLAAAGVLTGEWWPAGARPRLRLVYIFLVVSLGLLVLPLSGRMSARTVRYSLHSYGHSAFTAFEVESAYLQNISCHNPEVRLAHYPAGSYYYWFSGMKPVGKYIYMWPWVAEVGLQEVIAELDRPQTLAVVVRQEMILWERYDTREYLRELDELLEWKYIELSPGVYVSPALFRLCPPSESSTPPSLALP
jgi:hypothetical protein